MKKVNDLGDNLYKIHPVQPKTESVSIHKFYTLFGRHDFLDDNLPRLVEFDDVKMFAYSVKHGNVTTYFCKIDKRGRLYNPIGLMAQSQVRRNRQRSKDNWQFRKQEKNVFDFYINFLKTKNPAHLHVAERERI